MTVNHTTQVRTGKETSEVRVYILDKKVSGKKFGKLVRSHWGIENRLHWQLDVNFGEDRSRVSKRHEAENLALLRRLTLTLLQAHPVKLSIAKKRFAAALDRRRSILEFGAAEPDDDSGHRTQAARSV